ncbi:hypothetical protein GCM10025880_28790 [Methylorubrum aminovorans]|nr:hypothetical protein GCM10025880_28790 [Methylorubrum aminovorans]
MAALDGGGREGLAGHGAIEPIGETRAIEHDGEKFRVQIAVFEQQDVQGCLGAARGAVL